MPITTSETVLGLKALGEKFRLLSDDMQKRAAAAATGAAARIVKKKTVTNIQAHPSVDTGSMRDAVIVKKLSRSQAEGLTSAHIVTYRGKGKPRNKKGQKIAYAPHAHFVEFGTVKMPAEPSLGPALESERGTATQAMVDRLRQRIAAVAK